MKTILQNLKCIAFVVALFLVVSQIQAQTRTASVTGNWNSASTWGGAAPPTSVNDVVINNGITVTVDVAAQCASITINGGNAESILTISSTNSLNVGGAITINSATANFINKTIAVGAGILTCASVSMATTQNNNRTNLLTISTGTATVSGNLTMNDASASRNQVNITGSGTLNVAGSFTGGGTTFNTASTVDYNGTSQDIKAATYGNLTLSGSGTKTINNISVTVNGTLSMNGAAALAVSGISGALNYGGTSTLEYASTSAQTTGVEFPSSGGPLNLRINNTSASGVTLSAARTLNGLLTLTNGVLNTTSTNILTIGSTGSSGLGNNSSFVNGPMQKIGSSVFTFPIGKSGTGIRPIGISNLGSSQTITAEFIRTAPPNRTNLTAGITQISNCEYWTINGITSDLFATLSWTSNSPCNASGYVNDLATLRAASYNGTNWFDGGNTGTSGNPTSGTVTSTQLFSGTIGLTLGSSTSATNPLPVKFSGITAFEKQAGIQIDWIAYQEDNVDMYQVEHSADGIVFNPIGTVSSRNSSVETSYSFFDASPLPGVNFYRLRNVDFDGKSGYSNIVKVDLDKSVKTISFYPNPVRGEFISLQSSDLTKGNYSVRVMNSAGQQVYTQRFNHTGGAINQTIHLPVGMQSGIYILQLDRETSKVLSKTFVVQK
ncbi:MAG: T9SS type A sorting domain-containing protein [Chitinophagaceae bacterium]|nr:T9SS type A sorting domain-containing protein [Chitinophagaceae bacterium]